MMVVLVLVHAGEGGEGENLKPCVCVGGVEPE